MKSLKIVLFCISLCFVSCGGKEKRPIQGDTAFQRELNAKYKDVTTSPLKESDRKTFSGLDFFKFDPSYKVLATLKRTPNSPWFTMKTTTERVSEERVYGVLYFELKGKSHQLEIYQGKELMTKEGFEDYLFLPFLDETNGVETYGGGRYIDVKIPESETMLIDFNTAYNPYCVYNSKYSCPIVPRKNYLKIRVEAGVKNFNKQ